MDVEGKHLEAETNTAERTIAAVRSKLLAAEEAHCRAKKNLNGLKRVLGLCDKLGTVKEAKFENGEETGPTDSLIEECLSELQTVISFQATESDLVEVDFDQWANTIESDVRAQDPMMLSFDSGSDEEEEGKSENSRSFRLRRDASTSSRGGNTMLNILMSNGKVRNKKSADDEEIGGDDKLFWLTTGAWAFAVIGMMITIGFLTKDFLVAQQSTAIQIERTATTPLELPAITICNTMPNVPAFADFPSQKYPGLPLFGVSTYIRSIRKEGLTNTTLITYPDTHVRSKGSLVEDVVVAREGEGFRRANKGFNVRREQESLYSIRTAGSARAIEGSGDSGFYCFRTGFKNREVLEPHSFDSSSGVSLPAVTIKVFRLRMLGACQAGPLREDSTVISAFVSELFLHAEKLKERGILDFNERNPTVLQTHSQTVRKYRSRKFIDFYCNVYFFSGFFYPSLDNADISYRFDESADFVWKETGKGPYYTAYSWQEGAPMLVGPDPRALQNDTYILDGIRVYAEEAASVDNSSIVSPSSSISVIDSWQSAIYSFRRVNIAGKNSYQFKEAISLSVPQKGIAISKTQVSFDFSTFETETILTTPTMSWPEFLTDVFEFVGLFTGICFFTLIVAPAHSLV